jgi:hypothetical protein
MTEDNFPFLDFLELVLFFGLVIGIPLAIALMLISSLLGG